MWVYPGIETLFVRVKGMCLDALSEGVGTELSDLECSHLWGPWQSWTMTSSSFNKVGAPEKSTHPKSHS